MTHKAIQTEYRGHLFRSRLEARWAVFLDALGVRWEYEKEGYSLPSGKYLPDFWLPIANLSHDKVSGYWLEIKPSPPSELEESLLMELSIETGHNGFLFYGNVGEQQVLKTIVLRTVQQASYFASQDYTKIIITTGSCLADGNACALVNREPIYPVAELFTLTATRTLWDDALRAGRSARFEHGQKGRQL